jgi:mRNA-degrading endonuclease RelE of RelBE toxin-antitoxin system
MPFQVILTPSAEADLDYFKRFEQRVVVDAARRYLRNDADVESQHRKKLRANPMAPWELRFGKYRVFYELVDVTAVKIVAIGYKEHNDLFIRGRRVKLRERLIYVSSR